MKENERPDLQKFKKVILSICYGKANKMLKGTRNFFLFFFLAIQYFISETNEREKVEKKRWIEKYRIKHQATIAEVRKR